MEGQGAIVAGDPVEGDGAAVGGEEALAAEPDVGDGAEEGGEDGLHVAAPREEREGPVGPRQGLLKRREEPLLGPAEDLERGVVVGPH